MDGNGFGGAHLYLPITNTNSKAMSNDSSKYMGAKFPCLECVMMKVYDVKSGEEYCTLRDISSHNVFVGKSSTVSDMLALLEKEALYGMEKQISLFFYKGIWLIQT